MRHEIAPFPLLCRSEICLSSSDKKNEGLEDPSTGWAPNQYRLTCPCNVFHRKVQDSWVWVSDTLRWWTVAETWFQDIICIFYKKKTSENERFFFRTKLYKGHWQILQRVVIALTQSEMMLSLLDAILPHINLNIMTFLPSHLGNQGCFIAFPAIEAVWGSQTEQP